VIAFHFFSDVIASTHIFTLSLHDALPIYYNCRNNSLNEQNHRFHTGETIDYRIQDLSHIDPINNKCDIVSHQERTDKPGLLFLRSEEHTSELQSRENLVCRLLLEKNNT